MDLTFLKIGEKYSRPELANRWGYASHHAISRGVVTPQGLKLIILFVTRVKQQTLTQYDDFLSGGLLFWEGQEKHGTDKRIIDAKLNDDEIHLFYREVHHTKFEYKVIVILQDFELKYDGPSKFIFKLEHDQGYFDDLERFKNELELVSNETEREEIKLARIGQGKFRQQLLEYWDGRCAVTGVDLPVLLMASHIKPWRSSKNTERLNPFNGLLLLPQYDKLFDKGFLSFDEKGSIILSKILEKRYILSVGVDLNCRISKLNHEHDIYLSYHKDNIFLDLSGDD